MAAVTGLDAGGRAAAPLERLANDDDEALRQGALRPAGGRWRSAREEALSANISTTRRSTTKSRKRRNAISEQLAKATHAQPRAHMLVELPLADDARIFDPRQSHAAGPLGAAAVLEALSPREPPPVSAAQRPAWSWPGRSPAATIR